MYLPVETEVEETSRGDAEKTASSKSSPTKEPPKKRRRWVKKKE